MDFNSDPRTKGLRTVQQEDFSSINPMAIWEAKKRLFHLAVVEHEIKLEAADYLVRNRLHLSQKFFYDKCKEMIDNGEIKGYDYTNQLIVAPYQTQWFAPWVSAVNIFWDRIEYFIDEPSEEKHIAFRQSCTSGNAFSGKQKWEHNPNEPFPVEKLQVVEDVPAVNHVFEPHSNSGVVYLHSEGDQLFSISVGSAPFWIWEGEALIITKEFTEESPIILHVPPRDPSTKSRIDFLNGTKVSEKVLSFIRSYCLNEESINIHIDSENCTIYSSELKISSDTKRSKKDILLRICSIIDMFDQKQIGILSRTLKQNSWLENALGLSEYEGE